MPAYRPEAAVGRVFSSNFEMTFPMLRRQIAQSLSRRAPLNRTYAAAAHSSARAGPLQRAGFPSLLYRCYATGSGGGGGGFPGFNLNMGPKYEKGQALKEHVRDFSSPPPSCNKPFFYQSVDLTELARQGKLDPTIGRDEGAIMVLSFCTELNSSQKFEGLFKVCSCRDLSI